MTLDLNFYHSIFKFGFFSNYRQLHINYLLLKKILDLLLATISIVFINIVLKAYQL